MNGGIPIVCNNLFRDQDGVFKVITMPWHESHTHVLTQCQFAKIRGCAISNDITTGDDIPSFYYGALIDIGVLVGTGVFHQIINVYPNLARDVGVDIYNLVKYT